MQTEEHASTDITQDMPDVRAILASIKSIDKQISELTEQRNAIDTQIAELSKQRGEGVEEMAHAREQIDRFLNAAMGIEQPDTGAVASTEPVASPVASAVPAPATSKVAPKYRDPATGQTWSGRGKPPLWIAGKDRDQFLITPASDTGASPSESPAASSVVDESKTVASADSAAQEEAPKTDSLPLDSAPSEGSSQGTQDTPEPDDDSSPAADHYPDEDQPRDLLDGWDNGGGFGA